MKRFLHLGLTAWHVVLGTVVAVLSNDFALPVTATVMSGPPGPEPGVLEVLFRVRVGPLVAVFLYLAAADHALAAVRWTDYIKDQRQRWAEYSLSATIMMVLVVLLCGISDLTALLHVCLNYPLCMLCGYLVEQEASIGVWFWTGTALASPVWIGVWTQLGANSDAPWFVWLIVASMMLLFSLFPAVQVMQFKRGWDAHKADDMYCYLSLFAKTTLAMLVFANTLV